MKKFLYKSCLFIILITCSLTLIAQTDSLRVDSLRRAILTAKDDTNKVKKLNDLIQILITHDVNVSQYVDQSLLLSKKLNFKKGEAFAYYFKGVYYTLKSDYDEALKNDLIALHLMQEIKNKYYTATAYLVIGQIYVSKNNYAEALKNYYLALKSFEEIKAKAGVAECFDGIADLYSIEGNDSEAIVAFSQSLKVYEELKEKSSIAWTNSAIGTIYLKKGKYDEDLEKQLAALKLYTELEDSLSIAWTNKCIGDVYEKQGEDLTSSASLNKFSEAQEKYNSSLSIYKRYNYKEGLAYANLGLGITNIKLENIAKARNYLQEALNISTNIHQWEIIRDSYNNFSELDSITADYKQAYKDYKKYILYRDSISNKENTNKALQANMQYDFDKKESIAKAEQLKKDEDAKRVKNQQYFAIAALGIVVLAVLIIALIQFRNNKQKQKANFLITQQKEKVEATLTELKSTQAQLIQSEKMASLGELTAGIAHEIQNPLNFVNNFSEVNTELIEEADQEIDKGNISEVKTILNDIKENAQKIIHHGKRADAIVKNMLQHSRTSTGQKEPTDINTLADEYLRLSYHGMRAKDKSFNASMQTDFDNSIGKINIIPQDIGRVLLNLFNNAFYAVNEKAKQQTNGYEPTILLGTNKLGNSVELTVKDNGNGIPQKVIDKIFQPFFTTKPTGEGTGLGLSLSYDIIKAHGGEIKVETKEGLGTEFIIALPVV